MALYWAGISDSLRGMVFLPYMPTLRNRILLWLYADERIRIDGRTVGWRMGRVVLIHVVD